MGTQVGRGLLRDRFDDCPKRRFISNSKGATPSGKSLFLLSSHCLWTHFANRATDALRTEKALYFLSVTPLAGAVSG